MNRNHRTVWNDCLRAFVAVPECATARGKRSAGGVVAGAALALSSVLLPVGAAHAQALPTGGQVTAGQASINTHGAVMNIDQTSHRAAINWNTFNIGAGGTVNFNQPSASAVTLNRVVGNERSVIDGALNANGSVWILNSQGVLFNRSAQVNVGSLVATTLGMSDEAFMAGSTTFEGNGGPGSIINLGTLSAATEGHIALLGQHVANEGVIHATLGSAILAAGDKVSLNFNGNSLVGVTIERGVLNALVENHQAIIADGGLVTLTAKGLDEVMRTVVNNTGEVRAQTIAEREGRIFLLGGMENDRIEVAGRLDASAPNGGNGGFIETSAARVVMHEGRVVTTLAANGQTGTFLIDPNDFNIGVNAGNGAPADITAAQLVTDLGLNNVTISTATQGTSDGNGDIFVNDPVSWSAPTKLTLIAERNIFINNNISIGNQAGGLALHYGQGAIAENNLADYFLAGTIHTELFFYFSPLIPGNVIFLNGGIFEEKKGSDGEVITYNFRDSAFVTSRATSFADDGTDPDESVSPFALGAFSWEVLPGDGHMIVLQPKDQSGAWLPDPIDGDFVRTNGIDAIAALFGMKSSSVDYINSEDIFDGETTNFSVVFRDITLAAGQSVTMSWNYVGMDYVPFNDASFLSFVNTSNANDSASTIAGLNTEVLVLGATNPGSGNWSTDSYRSTGWQTTTMVAGEAGVYRIGFAVFNLGDDELSPYLAVDVVPGTTRLNGSNFAPIPLDPNGPIGRGVGTVPPPPPPPAPVEPPPPPSATDQPLNNQIAAAINSVAPISGPEQMGSGQMGTLLPATFLVVVEQGPVSDSDGQQSPGNVVFTTPSLTLPFAAPGDLMVVGTPNPGDPANVVSLSEAKQLMGDGDGETEGEREVRVPVSRNSLAQIVNGGVRLPGGVEQKLFVVRK